MLYLFIGIPPLRKAFPSPFKHLFIFTPLNIYWCDFRDSYFIQSHLLLLSYFILMLKGSQIWSAAFSLSSFYVFKCEFFVRAIP